MIAAIFPGQGSQHSGMGKELYEASAAAKAVFGEVHQITHVDIAKICFESDDDTLRQTQNAQLALFTCGVAAFNALEEDLGKELHVLAMAGHSVGEYAALAAAGIIEIGDGALLVQRRGELMAQCGMARPGAMSAVLGIERDVLEMICDGASEPEGVVVVANDNCPGQLVISGDSAAVGRAEGLAKESGAKRVLRLNVSGAFHSPLMEEPAEAMGMALRPELFHDHEVAPRVYSNVTADQVVETWSWPNLLEAQLRSPVRWTETVQNMIRDGVTVFIECGAGEVLSGLTKRISKDVQILSVRDVESMKKTSEALRGWEARA